MQASLVGSCARLGLVRSSATVLKVELAKQKRPLFSMPLGCCSMLFGCHSDAVGMLLDAARISASGLLSWQLAALAAARVHYEFEKKTVPNCIKLLY